MEYNFEEDLKKELRAVLNRHGIRTPSTKTVRDLLIDYFTIREKVVFPVPRTVDVSPVLSGKVNGHPKRREIKHIEKLLQEGVSVNGFQNRRLFQTGFHDHLVYEWGIYHFHLSLIKEQNGFQKQVNDLLFAYIDDRRAILLDATKHSDGIFGDNHWLEILHDYYPEVLEPYKETVIKSVDPIVDSVQRQMAWDAGLTLGPTPVRDVCYWPKGNGRVTTAHSNMVVGRAHQVLVWLYKTDDAFKLRGAAICAHFGLNPNAAQFKLKLGDSTIEITEKYSSQPILAYPNMIQVTYQEHQPSE